MAISLIKYFGGKGMLQSWIRSHFPYHTSYVEPYGGAGHVILNKTLVSHNLWNDVDPYLYNLMYHVKYNETLANRIYNLECNRETFEKYKEIYKNFQDSETANETFALAMIVVFRMSRGGLGKEFSETKRLRGGRAENVNAWENFKLNVPEIRAKLSRLELCNNDAIDIIQSYNTPNTLVYADPTYVHETRSSKKIYRFEMTNEQHEELCDTINTVDSKVVLSGYMNSIYQRKLSNWNVHMKTVANHSGQGKKKQKRIETVWCNF